MSPSTSSITIAHLTASPFFGGPERQMLGLTCAMPAHISSHFLCMMENGKAQPFVNALNAKGVPTTCLEHNHPHLIKATREVARELRHIEADVLLAHGYKADIVGLAAARLVGIPFISVSRGWTGATRKVRLNEWLDRRFIRHADSVVCVSEGQAKLVRASGVKPWRVRVARNSINVARFSKVDEEAGRELRAMFPAPIMHVVMAIGRLSPEKGFDRMIEAAALVRNRRDDVGFLILGEGPKAQALQQQIRSLKLQRNVIMAGFRSDVDRLLPHAACLAQASYAEGLPNVVLEAMAASLPVVASSAGGTPELVEHGVTGFIVAPGDAVAIAEGVLTLLGDSLERAKMGAAARRRVEEQFTFASQAEAYEGILRQVLGRTEPAVPQQVGAVA